MNNDIKDINLNFRCPADYHAMPDVDGGKFCSQCQKKVYDFTTTPAYVFRQILVETDNKLCGQFTAAQMAFRPLYNYPALKKWLSAATVLIAISLWEGKALAQQKDPGKQAMSKINNADSIAECDFGPNDPNAPDIYPEFLGGQKGLEGFLENNLRPIKGLRERVYVQFMVEIDGSLSEIKILSGLDENANKEVVRVLKMSPKWKPAVKNKKAIRWAYVMPIII
ncbi:MAG: hypothetical protein EOP54_26360 [Sphingobacteriales bacterium]|nr:MAG: hypothetical protein EOP54_26360 [Sphingobacteriales bacterium]